MSTIVSSNTDLLKPLFINDDDGKLNKMNTVTEKLL